MNSISLALKVLELPSAKVDLIAMNFESLYQLSLDAAVVVMKNASSASKAENVSLLVSVVNEVLAQMEKKAISSVALETSKKEIVQKFESLKHLVDDVVPVVFSRLPHLNPSVLQTLAALVSCLSLCKKVSSGEEVAAVAPFADVVPVVPAAAMAVPVPVVPAVAPLAVAVSLPAGDSAALEGKILSPKRSDVKKA